MLNKIMNLSKEKKQEIEILINDKFLKFIASKQLSKSDGKIIGVETYARKLDLVEEFTGECIL